MAGDGKAGPAAPGAPASGYAGRVAVVTGAGAGFGAAFACALAERGAIVALLDIDIASAERVAAELPDAFALHCDVADDASVEAAFAAITARTGGIDILINNAGLHTDKYNKGFVALGSVETRRLFDVNIMGVINCTVAACAAMAGRPNACILNIASIAAYTIKTAYGISKLAVRGLTLSFAQELAPDGIRVNAVAPGLMATDTIRATFRDEFFQHYADNLQLIHRMGEVEDIVKAMLFLCGPDATFITGDTLRVTGGYPAMLQ